jgi:hypothetical protein
LQLSSLRLGLNVIRHNRDILEIQSGVDFVHKVQRRGLEDVQCEYKSQRGQSLSISQRPVISIKPQIGNVPFLHQTGSRSLASSFWAA